MKAVVQAMVEEFNANIKEKNMEKSDEIVKELKKIRVYLFEIGTHCTFFLGLIAGFTSYLARGGWGVFGAIILFFVSTYYIGKILRKLEREIGLRDEFDNYID